MQLFVFLTFSTLALAQSSPPLTPSTCVFDELGIPTPCSQAGYSCFTTRSCTGMCQPSQYDCTSGNNAPCPTGWTCSIDPGCQGTAVSGIPCDGVCAPSTASTPVVPCIVGNNGPCATGSTCTPTVPCTPTAQGGLASCAGQCISTDPPPQFVTVGCVVSAPTGCPPYSYCYPTSECIGFCSATGTILPPTTTYMTMSNGPSSTGPPTTTRPTTARTMTTATLTTSSTPATCGWEYVPCKAGYTCRNPHGGDPGMGEQGDCMRDHWPKKRRLVAGNYFEEE